LIFKKKNLLIVSYIGSETSNEMVCPLEKLQQALMEPLSNGTSSENKDEENSVSTKQGLQDLNEKVSYKVSQHFFIFYNFVFLNKRIHVHHKKA